MKMTQLLVFMFFTCNALFAQKSENQIASLDFASNNVAAEASVSKTTTVAINCTGTCGCSLEGVLSGGESYVQCSYDDCTMELEFTDVERVSGETTNYVLNDETTMEVSFLADFMSYVESRFPESKITAIEVVTDDSNEAVTFIFEDAQGVEHSTMFAKIGGEKFQITCDGDCGCREVYSFETKSASCSCDDCTMTVEEASTN